MSVHQSITHLGESMSDNNVIIFRPKKEGRTGHFLTYHLLPSYVHQQYYDPERLKILIKMKTHRPRSKILGQVHYTPGFKPVEQKIMQALVAEMNKNGYEKRTSVSQIFRYVKGGKRNFERFWRLLVKHHFIVDIRPVSAKWPWVAINPFPEQWKFAELRSEYSSLVTLPRRFL